MKNFRKTIIALATVAAMLVPSVAMAATLTTTVDKDIDGDVYVGFYDGAILKDVVKTTVDDITVSDATPAGTEETLPATVTISDAVAGTDKNGVEVRKLTFTAKADASITAWAMLLSYDSTKIVPVPNDSSSWHINITYDKMKTAASQAKYYPYNLTSYIDLVWDDFAEQYVEESKTMTNVNAGTAGFTYAQIGDRVAMSFAQQAGGSKASINDGLKLFDFYYKVLDGQTVDKDTFKLEKEIGTGTFNAQLGSNGAEYGLKLSGATPFTYGAWNNGTAVADSIKLVTPWDVQESTTKDLNVTVPEGAEDYTPTMFIWDADQIAQCAPITTFTKN